MEKRNKLVITDENNVLSDNLINDIKTLLDNYISKFPPEGGDGGGEDLTWLLGEVENLNIRLTQLENDISVSFPPKPQTSAGVGQLLNIRTGVLTCPAKGGQMTYAIQGTTITIKRSTSNILSYHVPSGGTWAVFGGFDSDSSIITGGGVFNKVTITDATTTFIMGGSVWRIA